MRPDAANLERFLRGRLAGYVLPRAWRFVDALPRDSLGKLLPGAGTGAASARGMLPRRLWSKAWAKLFLPRRHA